MEKHFNMVPVMFQNLAYRPTVHKTGEIDKKFTIKIFAV